MREQTPRKATKIRRSTKQWQQIIKGYKASGLTQGEYCVQESLPPSTFSKWRNRITQGTVNDTANPMFVDLAKLTGHDQRNGWDIELTLSDGVSLRLRQS